MELIYCRCGCGKTRPAYDIQGRVRYYINGHHMRGNRNIVGNKFRAGYSLDRHPNWKGGRYLNKQGYIRVALGGGKRELEHVVVMEGFLGRKLLHDEVVHHKDGDRQNNSIENLEVLSPSEHNRIHKIGRRRACNLNN